MSRAALKAMYRKHLSLDELLETLAALPAMPSQAEALIGSTLLEDALKSGILLKLRTDLSNNDVASLFDNDAPLASFSARTNMAFAMNIIGEKTRADLKCIRDIRNAFAHARISLSFETPEVADAFPGLTFSTFGGNPVSMAVGLAVIKVIEEDDLRTNCRVVGDYFHDQLLGLQEKYPIIGEVRGMGIMQAIELVKDPKTKEPNPEAVLKIFEETKRQGVLIGKGGLYGNVIRTGLMLNSSTNTVDQLIKALDAGLALC